MAARRTRKIRGSFCEREIAPKESFAKRSFRWKRSGGAWLLIGCPVGQWAPRAKRCKVGTRVHSILSPTIGHCRDRGRRVVK
jgi:hypothetical protein